MRVRRAHKAQAQLTWGRDVVGVLAGALEQGFVFEALDGLAAAKAGRDVQGVGGHMRVLQRQ
jgi:hypothetical protein